VLADEHRRKVFLSAARVRATFLLVDGFVGGTWKVEKTRKAARLVIETFGPLPESDRDALLEEGKRLVRFVGDGAEAFEARFAQGV
jgi:uncharacterized membrane protein YqjE